MIILQCNFDYRICRLPKFHEAHKAEFCLNPVDVDTDACIGSFLFSDVLSNQELLCTYFGTL